MQDTSTANDTATVAVGDLVEVNDPWSFITGTGKVMAVEPWALGSTVVTVQLEDGRRTRTYPYYVQRLPKAEVCTATWCCTRNGYADDSVGCTDDDHGHIHYDVEYDVATGRVLTSSDEQAGLRELAEAGR